MTEKSKQTEDVESLGGLRTPCERAAYDDVARHFGVDIMALRHYFPRGRP